jgi:hypothetical protein
VEAGGPNRTDSRFAENPIDIDAQRILGADLVKFPG